MEQEISLEFSHNFTCFSLLFTPASLTESCSFWYGLKDHSSLQKLDDKTDEVKSDTRDVYSPERLRGGSGANWLTNWLE